MKLLKAILLALITLTATAVAQRQGAYFQWRNGNDVACASNAPNPSWRLASGPYFDGECSRPIPKRSDLPSSSVGPTSGGVSK